MNLMYFKNLRGDRDGGTTGLLSGGRRVTAGFDDGGGALGRPYGGVRGVGGASARSWFNAGVAAGGASALGRAGAPAAGAPATGAGSSSLSSVAAAGAPSAAQPSQPADASAMQPQQHHVRTHPLGLFDAPRHADAEDHERPGSGRHQSAARWGPCEPGPNGGAASLRPDYRYTRVDRQRTVDSAFDAPVAGAVLGAAGAGGAAFNGASRSVRSGLYAGEHQFTGEVCLSVSGLRGPVSAGNRPGKQVSFGRNSPPDGSGPGSAERERSRESDKRSQRNGAGANKENGYGSGAEVRGTLPRSAIVASKRPSPERLLAVDPPPRRSSSREDSADGRRRRNATNTAETSLSLPEGSVRMRAGSGRRGERDSNRLSAVSNEPNLDELIDAKDVNLNELPRDCFILPVHLVNRFLPLGLTVSPAPVLCSRSLLSFFSRAPPRASSIDSAAAALLEFALGRPVVPRAATPQCQVSACYCCRGPPESSCALRRPPFVRPHCACAVRRPLGR